MDIPALPERLQDRLQGQWLLGGIGKGYDGAGLDGGLLAAGIAGGQLRKRLGGGGNVAGGGLVAVEQPDEPDEQALRVALRMALLGQ